MATIKTLMAQIKEYKRSAILTPIFAVLEVVMEIMIPVFMAKIIDNGISKGDMPYAMKMGAFSFVLVLCSLTLGVLAGRFAAHASTGFAKNLRKAMYENIQTFAFSNIDKYSTAGLVTRMTTDVNGVQNAFQMIMRMCTRAPMSLIMALFMAFSVNAKLSCVFLVAMVFLVLMLSQIVTRAHKYFRQMFEQYDALNSVLQENVSAIRVVKAYVREHEEISKVDAACMKLASLSISAERIIVLNMPTMQLTVNSCILAISWFGAHLIVAESMTTGELLLMFSYIMTILMNLNMLSMIFVMMTMSAPSMNRIAEIINEKADIVNPEKPVMEVADGSITFDNVCFEYLKDKPVLNHINVEIKSGETIGIIGGTGGSKSTFVQMIPRLYDVKSGSVKVGGRDVREYDLEALRGAVSMVLQKNELFSGTIKDNLRWGDPNATDEDIIRVCKEAQADEFIRSFPDKYDTWIEQGGTNVSGGQKQRLCIARALLKKPKVLILDDSTSAVDTKTDSMIRKAFLEEIPDTTKIIISQRISSVMDADRIIVLEEGHIDGIGSHKELLVSNKYYRDVYEAQLKGTEDLADEEKGGEDHE